MSKPEVFSRNWSLLRGYRGCCRQACLPLGLLASSKYSTLLDLILFLINTTSKYMLSLIIICTASVIIWDSFILLPCALCAPLQIYSSYMTILNWPGAFLWSPIEYDQSTNSVFVLLTSEWPISQWEPSRAFMVRCYSIRSSWSAPDTVCWASPRQLTDFPCTFSVYK